VFKQLVSPLLVFFSLMTSAVALGQETIRIAVDNWLPYQDEKAVYLGSIHRVITEAFDHEGIKVEYGFHPWARSLALAEEGIWDAAGISQRSEEKERKFYFSEPVMSAEKVFFHLNNNNFDWKVFSDLKQQRIGTTIGYSYGDEFDQFISTGVLDIISSTRNQQSFRMLLKGRIDLFLLEKRAGEYLLSSKFSDQKKRIVFHPKPVQTTQYHLIFSRHSSKAKYYLSAFNRGLKWLQDQGLVEKCLAEGLAGEYQI